MESGGLSLGFCTPSAQIPNYNWNERWLCFGQLWKMSFNINSLGSEGGCRVAGLCVHVQWEEALCHPAAVPKPGICHRNLRWPWIVPAIHPVRDAECHTHLGLLPHLPCSQPGPSGISEAVLPQVTPNFLWSMLSALQGWPQGSVSLLAPLVDFLPAQKGEK